MLINNKKIYFEVDRQDYIEILEYLEFDEIEKRKKEKLEIRRATKEHIKRQVGEELRSKNPKHWGVELKERLKTLFYDIETIKLVFNPHRKEDFKTAGYNCKNLFVPTTLYKTAKKARQEAIAKNNLYKNVEFLNKYPHIKLLFNNVLDSKKDRIEYFINWLATALVSLKKNGTAIVLKGIQGTGKGFLYENIIQPLIGQKYTYTFKDDDLKTRFNNNLQNKLFVVGNEIKGDFRDGNTMYETLKMWVTDRDLRVELKNKDAFEMENFFNILLFSNHDTPLQIQATDRRYTVYNTAETTLKEKAEMEFKYGNFDKYMSGVKAELEGFVKDLFCFDYKEKEARIPQITEEKTKVYLSSVAKSEIFKNALKNWEEDILENLYLDYVENWKAEDFIDLANKNNIETYNQKPMEIYLKVLEQVKNNLYLENYIQNNHLTFLYIIGTGETQNTQKIGTALTILFGKSTVKKINGKPVRIRILANFEVAPF